MSYTTHRKIKETSTIESASYLYQVRSHAAQAAADAETGQNKAVTIKIFDNGPWGLRVNTAMYAPQENEEAAEKAYMKLFDVFGDDCTPSNDEAVKMAEFLKSELELTGLFSKIEITNFDKK